MRIDLNARRGEVRAGFREITMSSKRGFLNRSAAFGAGVGVAALMCVAFTMPARADDDGWKHHHGHHDGRGYYAVVPGYFYGGYYAYAPPPVVYYQPQPVYVAPPPEVYAPPPVYYSPPGLSLGINIPLR
jgi:hypothetical protein